MAEVEFCGEQFRIVESVSPMVLMRLTRVLKLPMTEEENVAKLIEALDEVLEQVVDPADWERFQDVAVRTRASMHDLTDFFERVREARKPSTPPTEPAPAAEPAFELFPA